MTRFKSIVEYKGTDFVGWQRQDNGLSIQELIEGAIQKMAQETVVVHAAGRTDAGVHAMGQVISFDLNKNLSPLQITDAINFYLRPHPIAILSTEKADDDFHARFSAKSRIYIYQIINRRSHLTLDQDLAWFISKPLVLEPMQHAANMLCGKHDFTSFRSSQCQAASPLKTLTSIHINQDQDKISVQVEAPSFLHHQVRNIVGTLKLIGLGYWPPEKMLAILNAKDRAAAGPTAPPIGLYFYKVLY
ncbi:MAG: tRNA pseudouridine(38-40) synthase TruA [Alphaproteobacteria bacterium]|nr:tRNA pseudouridine(38-40) synthase TruA [Alphaproteobacteria bacterium]